MTNRTAVAGFFVALAMTVALPSIKAEAGCQLRKLASLPVSIENNQIVVTGALNHHPIKFLVDTGFPSSIILAPDAAKYNLAVGDVFVDMPYHTLPVGFGFTDAMQVGKFTVPHALLGVFGNRLDFGDTELVALLGNDMWAGYEVDIDLPHKVITLLQADTCANVDLAYWTDRYNVLDFRPLHGKVLFEAKLDGREVLAALDSGTPYSTISEKIANGLGIRSGSPGTVRTALVSASDRQSADMYSLTQITYGLGYNLWRSPDIYQAGEANPFGHDPKPLQTNYIGSFAGLSLDQETIAPAKLRLLRVPQAKAETGTRLARPVFDEELVLGVDFLLSHHLLISNSQHKLYFSYEGGPALQGSPS